MQNNENLYLWTGDGWGKTTSSLGAALRALGHNKRVIVIQFMKGRKERIGEYKIRKRLGHNFQIFQFGRPGWVNLKKPGLRDRQLALKGFEFAKSALTKKPFLLVLDEINLACRIGLLDTNDIIAFLKRVPKSVNVYLTGRKAPESLMQAVDYVNEIRMLKGTKRLIGKKGIDY